MSRAARSLGWKLVRAITSNWMYPDCRSRYSNFSMSKHCVVALLSILLGAGWDWGEPARNAVWMSALTRDSSFPKKSTRIISETEWRMKRRMTSLAGGSRRRTPSSSAAASPDAASRTTWRKWWVRGIRTYWARNYSL